MTHLVVLVDSERPDAYVNCVAYNLRSRAIASVSFVHVYGFPGDANSQAPSDLSSRVLGLVLQRLQALALRAEYVAADGSAIPLDERNGSLSAEGVKGFYAPVIGRSVSYDNEEVHYRNLRSYLRTIRRDRRDYLVDVTSCRKRFIGDFVALGLVDDLQGLQTFDVLARVDYDEPWRSLLHELTAQRPSNFNYVDLLETRIIRDCARAVGLRAPRFNLAWMLATGLVALGIGLNWWFGLESDTARWVNVVAQFATFAGLLFVFFPPRGL